MSAIKIRLITAGPHVVNDLGLTIGGAAGSLFDLVSQEAQDVSTSDDLIALVNSGDIVAVDPRDSAELINLSVAESVIVLRNHNQIHWGITGGRFGALDNPNITITNDYIPTFNAATDEFEFTDPAAVLTNNREVIEDFVGDLVAASPDLIYDDAAGTLVVADNFLSNTGDVLDSGTLTVASGASIDVAAGADLTIADLPVNPTDAANKEYVDAIASGLDHKESVQAASTGDTGFTFSNNGGAGDTLVDNVAGAIIIDGVTLVDGDRILIKDQTDPLQNGIYVVSGAGVGDVTTLTRADDQNGDNLGEISAGNSTFVEAGTSNGATGWVVSTNPGAINGQITVNTDPINWVQNSGQGTFSGADGIDLSGNTFTLDANTLAAAPIDSATDSIPFIDATDGTTKQATISDLVSGAVAVADLGPLDGLVVSTAAGVTTFGFDIQNLPVQTNIDTADRIPVWDSSANTNVYYTIAEVAGALSATDSFNTWNVDGVDIVADSSSDTARFISGDGITLTATPATDTLTVAFSNNNLVDTAVTRADFVPFFDTDDTGAPKQRTFDALLSDLNVLTTNDFGTGTGLLVKTGENPDTFTSRNVVASVAAAQEGAAIVNGDGIAGNITVGVDIDNLADSADALAATDQFIVNDGTNNVSMTGAQVIGGVLDSLNAIAISNVNGQPVLTIVDDTRGDKRLSTDSNFLTWSENSLGNNDWIRLGSATDAESGYIAPLDGTIVWTTGHCENTAGNSKDIEVYINGTSAGVLGTLTGATGPNLAGNASFVDTTLNIDFAQGDLIRLRAIDGASSGTIQDTVVNMNLKWRA